MLALTLGEQRPFLGRIAPRVGSGSDVDVGMPVVVGVDGILVVIAGAVALAGPASALLGLLAPALVALLLDPRGGR